jgi:hypothetical protein
MRPQGFHFVMSQELLILLEPCLFFQQLNTLMLLEDIRLSKCMNEILQSMHLIFLQKMDFSMVLDE